MKTQYTQFHEDLYLEAAAEAAAFDGTSWGMYSQARKLAAEYCGRIPLTDAIHPASAAWSLKSQVIREQYIYPIRHGESWIQAGIAYLAAQEVAAALQANSGKRGRSK